MISSTLSSIRVSSLKMTGFLSMMTIARRQKVSSKDRRGDSLLFLQSLQLFGQLGIQLVAAENGDDMRLQRAYEGNVTQDI